MANFDGVAGVCRTGVRCRFVVRKGAVVGRVGSVLAIIGCTWACSGGDGTSDGETVGGLSGESDAEQSIADIPTDESTNDEATDSDDSDGALTDPGRLGEAGAATDTNDDQGANVDAEGDTQDPMGSSEPGEMDETEVDGNGQVDADDAGEEAQLPGTEDDDEFDDTSDDMEASGPEGDEPGSDDEAETEDDSTASDDDSALMTDHCAAVADWDPEWVAFEEEVLALVNEVRAVGYDCDTAGEFEATEPLEMDPQLVCAARLHSLDMYENDYFTHESLDGTSPTQRIVAAGYSPAWSGENIAKGQQSPQQVVEGWLDSDGHCGNIMNSNYVHIGVGYHPGDYVPGGRFSRDEDYHLWTQAFASPGGQGGGGGGGGGFGGGFGGFGGGD